MSNARNLVNIDNLKNVDNSTNINTSTNVNNITENNNLNETIKSENLTNNNTSTNKPIKNQENLLNNLNCIRMHYEDCTYTEQCKKGFICKTYRCLTPYEVDCFIDFGLEVNNLCRTKKKYQEGKDYIKHKYVEHPSEVDVNRRKRQ